MNDKQSTAKTIDESGQEVLDPRKALEEKSLAVDLARAELDSAIVTAHKFPRIIDSVIKRIGTLACYNKESAENCVYALPRGGKPITGPSIGFANIVQQAWGNCQVAARVTFIDTKQKVVIAEGAFLDFETNSRSIVPVNRRIVDSKGRLFSEDMQIVTGMAAASIARRNAILQGVPRGIWHPIWLDAFGIVRGDVTTFAENKDKAFKALFQFGVKPEQVYLVLGLKGEPDMTYEHIPTLRGMYAALRDGNTTVEELFDPRKMTGKAFEQVVNPMGEAVAEEEAPDEADPTAGMGEPPATAQQSPAAAGKQAPEAAGKAADAPAGASAVAQSPAVGSAPAGSAAAPAPKTTEAKPAPELKLVPQASGPTNAYEYVEHWLDVVTACASEDEIKQRWGAERALRKTFEPFKIEQQDEMAAAKAARIKELK